MSARLARLARAGSLVAVAGCLNRQTEAAGSLSESSRGHQASAASRAARAVSASAGCFDLQAETEGELSDCADSERRVLGELRDILQSRLDGHQLGWRRLADAYGSAEQCLLCYLRAGEGPCDAPDAASRVMRTLAFRAHHNLDRPDITDAIEGHPARSSWPFVMAGRAPDGCPILFARLSHMDIADLIHAHEEEEITRFAAMWFEQALRAQAEVLRSTGAPCRGTYDVYDCAGVRSWYKVIHDVKDCRGVLSRIFAAGAEHYPAQLDRCFILNAPSVAMVVWRILSSFLSERVLHRVQISSGVPQELAEVLGGDEAVRRMLELLPLRDGQGDSGSEPRGQAARSAMTRTTSGG